MTDKSRTDRRNGTGESAQPWYGDPIKVVTLIGLLVALPLTANQVYQQVFAPPPPAVSIEYVLDVSRGMAGRIGNKNKLAAAKDEITSAVGGSPEIAHALRLAGGPTCSETYQDPRVDFAQRNSEAIEGALASVTTQGPTDFARSVRYAVNDIVRRQSQVDTKRVAIYFLIGGHDQCTKRPLSVISDELKRLDKEKTIDVSFKFVGVKTRGRTSRLLRRVKIEANKLDIAADVEIANTEQEIGESISPSP